MENEKIKIPPPPQRLKKNLEEEKKSSHNAFSTENMPNVEEVTFDKPQEKHTSKKIKNFNWGFVLNWSGFVVSVLAMGGFLFLLLK